MKLCFTKLPKDIINIILSFGETIKYRNGMYINQIYKSEKIYDLLLRIPKPKVHYNNNFFHILVRFTNNIYKFTIHTYLQNGIHYRFIRNYDFDSNGVYINR
jgi:hypothetical protein